jgi:hypothetical protein
MFIVKLISQFSQLRDLCLVLRILNLKRHSSIKKTLLRGNRNATDRRSIQSVKNRSNLNLLGLPKINLYNRNRNR